VGSGGQIPFIFFLLLVIFFNQVVFCKEVVDSSKNRRTNSFYNLHWHAKQEILNRHKTFKEYLHPFFASILPW
jgi:hypothetical protein